MLTLLVSLIYCGGERRRDAVSRGTERFLLIAVIILLIERLLFYATWVAAFVL